MPNPVQHGRPIHIIDREAYEERLAICLESGQDFNTAYTAASNGAYHTPWAEALTAAYKGDRSVIDALHAGEKAGHGDVWAAWVMAVFSENLRDEIAILEMLCRG